MKKSCIFVLCLVLWGILAGCGNSAQWQEAAAAYGDTPIKIVGLTEEPFTVTPNELLALPCVTKQAKSVNAQVGTVTGTGPTLDTFLQQYGKRQSDFNRVRFLAKDGYKTVLKEDALQNEIILSVVAGKEALAENQQPLQILIPDAPSSYWAYQITQIEFAKE